MLSRVADDREPISADRDRRTEADVTDRLHRGDDCRRAHHVETACKVEVIIAFVADHSFIASPSGLIVIEVPRPTTTGPGSTAVITAAPHALSVQRATVRSPPYASK